MVTTSLLQVRFLPFSGAFSVRTFMIHFTDVQGLFLLLWDPAGTFSPRWQQNLTSCFVSPYCTLSSACWSWKCCGRGVSA